MHIKELSLRNFRNYGNLSLEFSPGINIITGRNATGKTNILESITVLSGVRSFRNASDTELVMWGKESYYCCVSLNNSKFFKFEIGFLKEKESIKKKAKIDGVSSRNISDYYGKFLTVVFSPEDINIVTGPPELRRKFFDSIISKADTRYMENLGEFKKILQSRNKLLRDISENSSPQLLKELDVWDSLFSERASYIVKSRKLFCERFNVNFREADRFISDNNESPNIVYSNSLAQNAVSKEDILGELVKRRQRDIFKGSTGIGPHRDEYVFRLDKEREFKNFSSQGQKRTAVVSLKIAECKFIEMETREKAVILIDDIFGELDSERKRRLLDMLKDENQVIITAVKNDFSFHSRHEIRNFEVLSGGIVKRK